MNEIDRGRGIHISQVVYSKEELWNKLSGTVNEMMDDTLAIEEREFLLARVYHLVDELKQHYIGGNTNEN